MPKKNMTPEERAAWGAKMKAARAAKKTELELALSEQPQIIEDPPAITINPGLGEEPQTTISTEVNVSELIQRIQELEAAQWRNSVGAQAPAGVNQNRQGKLIGTFEKYSTDFTRYPDPIERLANESRLAQFAFPLNYELEWATEVTEYETIDGGRNKEPKFTLKLNRIIRDEETGEATNGRYTICQLIMHEDPEAALVIAKNQGITVNEDDEVNFLNEMRYLRMRDWLLECFFPSITEEVKNKREMVIDGRLVEYFEVNSESGTAIPFNQLDAKKKLRF